MRSKSRIFPHVNLRTQKNWWLIFYSATHQELGKQKYENSYQVMLKEADKLSKFPALDMAYILLVPIKADGTHDWKDFVHVMFNELFLNTSQGQREVMKLSDELLERSKK